MSIKESSLGIGISLKKSPRTGKIMYINATLDLISIKAFRKLKIRRSLAGERFTHWLPLYFGENQVIELEEKEYDEIDQEMVTVKKTVD
jgi:hypothetical protein